MKASAVILAAGTSSRFGGGRDKLLAEWRGRTLIEYPIEAAVRARNEGIVFECVVVTRPDATRVKSFAAAESCRVAYPDPRHGSGISATLKAGIAALGPGADGAVVLLGDQPMITAAAVGAVVAAAKGSPQALVRAYYRGNADLLSHPVFIGRNHFGLVHETGPEQGFQALVEARRLRWTEVWIDGHNPDIDFAADLDRLA